MIEKEVPLPLLPVVPEVPVNVGVALSVALVVPVKVWLWASPVKVGCVLPVVPDTVNVVDEVATLFEPYQRLQSIPPPKRSSVSLFPLIPSVSWECEPLQLKLWVWFETVPVAVVSEISPLGVKLWLWEEILPLGVKLWVWRLLYKIINNI